MKIKLNIVLVYVIALLLLSPYAAFAGGGGGGGKKIKQEEPKYYSFEDLRNGIRNESFYFQNQNKPANALVSLGYYLNYPACASKNAQIGSMIKSNPGSYQIDSSHVYSGWNDNIEIPFNWDKTNNYVLKGDLIFSRGNGKGPDFVKMFSNWTHVAIVSDVQARKVFESTPDTNVDVNYGPNTFQHITYYSCKRFETLPYNARSYLVDEAIKKYRGLPYFPKMSVTEALIRFIFAWSDKDDISSMYCSKLVYQTYKNQINLDTGRTSVPYSSSLVDKNKPAPGGYLFSWIGISPDDIYYLPSLGPDFCYSLNLLSL